MIKNSYNSAHHFFVDFNCTKKKKILKYVWRSSKEGTWSSSKGKNPKHFLACIPLKNHCCIHRQRLMSLRSQHPRRPKRLRQRKMFQQRRRMVQRARQQRRVVEDQLQVLQRKLLLPPNAQLPRLVVQRKVITLTMP